MKQTDYKLKDEVLDLIRSRSDLKLAIHLHAGYSRGAIHGWLKRADHRALTRLKVLTAISRELDVSELDLIERV